MLVAEEKRKTNIAEYILYMWQVEDLIRAYQFNIDLIETNLISQYSQPPKVKNDVRDWYANLMLMMYREGVKDTGHLSFLKTLINELTDLHYRLLNHEGEDNYRTIFNEAAGNLEVYKKKLPNHHMGDIESCFNALYGLLLLRLNKKTVSKDTETAMSSFSKVLAYLSQRFLQIERGEYEL